MRKYDIVNWLGREHAYRSYLEVATCTTGDRFAYVDRGVFTTVRRLMYNVPAGYDDGFEILYRATGQDSTGLFRRALGDGLRFDLAFVDPYHSREASRRDMEQALSLLAPGGTLVVHDCNPPSRKLVTPEFRRGGWCGLTYAAFLDLVYSRDDLEFCVVDTDYGCGIVRAVGERPAPELRDRRLREEVRREHHLEWGFFDRHRTELLHLVSPREFKRLLSR
jgi:SAM-dependent methyltransferase